LWASVLHGQAGFIQIPNTYQIVIHPLQQFEVDPAQDTEGSSVGIVGVMFENRRRSLLSGVITSTEGKILQIDVHQATGNCPKYIQGEDL